MKRYDLIYQLHSGGGQEDPDPFKGCDLIHQFDAADDDQAILQVGRFKMHDSRVRPIELHEVTKRVISLVK